MNNKEKIIVSMILIVIGVAYRLFPHPANFAPIAAISLFSGFYFYRYFMVIPLIAMFFGDMFIGFYEWKLMLAVYFSFALIGLLGILIRKNKSIAALIGCSLAGSVLFFLITNFAVWAFSSWYPHTMKGLIQCYAMAIPFFKSTILGDLFYVSVIFGLYEILAQPRERLYFILAEREKVKTI